MEPANFPVAQQPPARPPLQTVRLGEAQGRGGWARYVLALVLFLAVTAAFAGAVYGAWHRPRDLAFAITTYYLIALLYCCLIKLEALRVNPATEAAATVRRRVRLAVWAVSVALFNTLTLRVADAMPSLALKLVVWGFTAVMIGIVFYLIFRRQDGESCDADLANAQAAAGRRPEEGFRGLSPEERV